jgi:hypothetical protein
MIAFGNAMRRCQLMKPSLFLLTTLSLSIPIAVSAQMTRVNSAVAVDGVVACFRARNFFITATTGPCYDYTPPRQVRVGETFLANGSTKTIRVIVASRAAQDMPDLGIRAGQWSCSAAESLEDMPLTDESGHTGTWLYIAQCQPIN